MALVQSKQIVAGQQIQTPTEGNDLLSILAEYVVPAGTTTAVNDVIEFGGIPAGCVPVEFIEHHTAGGGTATLDWGLLSGVYGTKIGSRTCGNEFAAASSVVAAGVSRLAKPVTSASQADDTVGWGAKVNGSALPAGMVIRASLIVRPAPIGMA